VEVRPLGTTGLPVTPVGLGLAALGRPAYLNLGHDRDVGGRRDVAALRRHAHEVLDAARDAGIGYVDAARSYGRAEEFLGGWLADRGIGPDAVTLGSKWGYVYTGDWRVDADTHEVKDHSLAALRRQAGETRDRLGPHLDLYQIHSATLDTGVLDDPGVLAELVRLRDQGLTVGLTVTGPDQAATLRRAVEVSVDGVNPFEVVQATWNLLEPSAGPALADARAAGWGVIVKEAVANGRLTPRNDDAEFRGERALLDRVAADLDTTVDAVAVAAVLAQPWADVVLSGAATVEQLDSNLAATAVDYDDAAARELAGLAEPPGRYWAARSDLAWT
jgi:aryl-alcohol dehydrogenase-like predicted oxidoreductase